MNVNLHSAGASGYGATGWPCATIVPGQFYDGTSASAVDVALH